MRPAGAERLLTIMKPGVVYRRAELARFSRAVDRELAQLVSGGRVRKAAPGLYYRKVRGAFGEVPPGDEALVRAYLKSPHFLLTSPNDLNSLGLGLTQLYNITTVLNAKRHGRVKLDGRWFDFKRSFPFPKKLSKEVLYVQLLNARETLVENPDNFGERLQSALKSVDRKALQRAADNFGKVSTKRLIQNVLDESHASVSA